MPSVSLDAGIQQFLDSCRIERGLAANSIDAYKRDLKRFLVFNQRLGGNGVPSDSKVIRRYIDSLYEAGLASRSIARHLTTLRNLYGFLLAEGRIGADPTEGIPLPKQWSTLPKYLNAGDVMKTVTKPFATDGRWEFPAASASVLELTV